MHKVAAEVRRILSEIDAAGGKVRYSFRSANLDIKRPDPQTDEQAQTIADGEARLRALIDSEPDNVAAALESFGCAW